MSQENQTNNETTDDASDDTQKPKTPLELVREQQGMQQQSREVAEQRPDPSPEVPGQSNPSNMRKHPQRQLG
jgi:hypothetical protein